VIVISGALVLVALVLLVLGVLGQDLALVYASIGVSVASLLSLLVGILQRRGEPLPGDGHPAVEQPVEPQVAQPGQPSDEQRELVGASVVEHHITLSTNSRVCTLTGTSISSRMPRATCSE